MKGRNKVFIATSMDGFIADKAALLRGTPGEIVNNIHARGYHRLYIDGGKTIQHFLSEDLIDEITITIIPVLLGGGAPLFFSQQQPLAFECVETKLFPGKIAQNHYKRAR